MFIDGAFRDAARRRPLRDREPGHGAAARGGRRGAGRPTWTRPSRPRAGPPTTGAGPGVTRATASASSPLGGPDRGERARRSASSRRSTRASRSPTPSASTCPRRRHCIRWHAEATDKLYGQVAPTARGHDRDDHPRAVRRGRRGHPVELPGADGRLEARARARDRQHGRDQAGLDDVAQPAPDRRARPPRRACRTACSTSSRARRHGRRGDRPPPGHRLRRVHRLHGGRPPVPTYAAEIEPQARAPGARRQEPAARVPAT